MSNAESVTIRTFHTDDLPALRRMTVEAFEGVSIDEGIEHAFGVINGRDWRWRKGRHVDLDAVRDPDGIFVAEFEGRPIGYVSTWKDHPGGIGHIPNLVVLPEHRGEGIGRRLLNRALESFRRAGLTHAKIETVAQNQIGNHLYPSLGFREVARQVHFVADLRQPATPESTEDVGAIDPRSNSESEQ